MYDKKSEAELLLEVNGKSYPEFCDDSACFALTTQQTTETNIRVQEERRVRN
jgi:hypothetical protein